MDIEEVKVGTESGNYPILIGPGIYPTAEVRSALHAILNDRPVLIVTDSNVGPLYGENLQSLLLRSGSSSVSIVQIPAGEASKNINLLQQLYRAALADKMGRDAVIAALGGGVVGDLAGFAAATFMRGIDYLQIPTSLLAMVDSSVGGKVGIDLEEGKNLVGAFYQPRLVVADLATLKTLPIRELRCGLAEVVKYGIIMDSELFSIINRNTEKLLAADLELYQCIVKRCCELKARVVAADERETTGSRAILNYGHTFGHAIESLTGYKRINHGEAISIGMVIAAELGYDLNMVDDCFVQKQIDILEKLGLPTDARRFELTAAAIMDCLLHDKKAYGGKPRFILPQGIGSVTMAGDIAEAKILQAIRRRCE